MHCVGEVQRFGMLNETVHIVIRLLHGNDNISYCFTKWLNYFLAEVGYITD
jgi:hypothetical protein